MKRVLIISYYWPPTGGSGVQRWVKFSKYLPQHGWQPVVYTPLNPERLASDDSLLKDVPQEAEIIRTRINEPYEIYRKLMGKKKLGEINPINSSKKSLLKSLALWARGNLFVPDPRVSWVRPSVRYLKKYLKEHPVDVVVTSGPPQSMHLIGRGLKRATGVKWVVDFRDPWTEMFYFKHLGLGRLALERHRRMEQSVLDECDAIISVTPLVQSDFQARTKTPVHLITNGFDEDDFACGEAGEGKFTIVHTGLFASDGNPTVLWDVLSELCVADKELNEKLELRLVGKVDAEIVESIKLRALGDKLVNLGYLPHQQTVIEQKMASVLILPLRKEPEYRKVLPGKIFEYLASRRPVLGIGQEDGAAAKVLQESRSGVMYDWENKAQMAAFIKAQWDAFKQGIHCDNDADISAYTRRELTSKLVSLLENSL